MHRNQVSEGVTEWLIVLSAVESQNEDDMCWQEEDEKNCKVESLYGLVDRVTFTVKVQIEMESNQAVKY